MTLKMIGCWLLAYRISRPFNTWPFPCPATVAPHLLKKLQFFRAQFSVGCVEQKQITQKSKEIWSSSMQKLLSCLSHTWVVYKKKTCGFLSFNKISFSKIFQETESHDVANVYKGHIENFLVGIGSLLLVSCLSNLSHKKRSAGTAWLIRWFCDSYGFGGA